MAGEFVVPSDGSEGLQQEVNLEKPPAEPVTLTTQMALEHVAVLKKNSPDGWFRILQRQLATVTEGGNNWLLKNEVMNGQVSFLIQRH